MSRSRTIVIALLSGWALLLLVTHRGSRSPYTYIPFMTSTVKRIVNPDALRVIAATRFFYDGSHANWGRTYNMDLPPHPFAAAIVAAFVRPYLLASYLTNFIFVVLLIIVAMRLAARFDISDRAMLLAGSTVLAMPPFVAYLGQPMHYIVGPIVNYLVIMIAVALPESDLRNPWIAGALTAILTLNYDFYVFGAAFAIYVLALIRLANKRHDLIYLAVSIVPVLVWRVFLHAITGGTASAEVREKFVETVIVEWAVFFRDPAKHILQPFIVSHIGVHIGLHEILTLIYWPVLVCCVIALWRQRTGSSGAARLLLLIVVMFGVEQIATGAFDFENNPRRALPVFFAFACAYCLAVDRRFASRAWKAVFVTMFALTSFLAFADVILDKPGAAILYIGPTINAPPKAPLLQEATTLRIAPTMEPAQALALQTFPRARLDMAGAFLFAQVFVAFWFVVLFALLRRAALLPRFAPAAFVAVWLLSAVRFL